MSKRNDIELISPDGLQVGSQSSGKIPPLIARIFSILYVSKIDQKFFPIFKIDSGAVSITQRKDCYCMHVHDL